MPVGSGRFRDHAQDPRGVLGMSCSSPLALGYEGCMAHTHGGPCWGESRPSCSAEAATSNKLELHPSRQENPPPFSSCTPCAPGGGTDVPTSQYRGRVRSDITIRNTFVLNPPQG